ncbi:MAG: hypothetical protein GQ582_08225 [Methyloprofundus sp.]|nr:hypothetical protein [Methyloprofundus sp.]
MQRTQHIVQVSGTSNQELHRHIAFHEAGHVVAIYIRNHQQQLPPVFFQVTLDHQQQNQQPFFARVEGGRLIENLPIAEIEKDHFATETERQDLKQAYEADIINLLAGPLAEAKYVAMRDDEIFNPYLVNIVALQNYGGHSDLEQAHQYLKYFVSDAAERDLVIKQLFTQAFEFIEDPKNWRCIQHFADYILKHERSTISCEEASATLEPFLS